MQTYEEQKAFYDEHWPAMRAALEERGPSALVAYIDGVEDGLQRRVLHMFVRQGVVMGEWKGKNLDAAIEVAKAGIRTMLDAAEAAEEDERRKGLTNMANVISYNLAADLADCWPGNEAARTEKHFEAGLQAATDCIRWREELGNPPMTLSMAWWAHGMHSLSLGRADDAAASWKKSLAYAREADSDETAFSSILGRGYLGLGRWAAGRAEGEAELDEALGAFEAQLGDEKKKEDARFGIDQLETARSRYAPK